MRFDLKTDATNMVVVWSGKNRWARVVVVQSGVREWLRARLSVASSEQVAGALSRGTSGRSVGVDGWKWI
jgi:hypothetical protein